jgi:ketosteroid isomerase-like protein
MPEEQVAGIMRDYVKAMADGDVEKALACCTEDAVMDTPYGTYKGKDEVKHSLEAMARNMKNMKVTETGNGIIVHGDKAFFEHVITGMFEGQNFEFLAMCAYEFSGDKITKIRSVWDKLRIAQQVVKGWPAKPMVNMIVKQTDKAMK